MVPKWNIGPIVGGLIQNCAFYNTNRLLQHFSWSTWRWPELCIFGHLCCFFISFVFPNFWPREWQISKHFSLFLRTYLGKIFSPKKSQKLPQWIHRFQRGSFSEFLGETIFPSKFLKNRLYVIIRDIHANFQYIFSSVNFINFAYIN